MSVNCEWGGDCQNGAVVRHVFDWGDRGRASERFCLRCAAMDREVYANNKARGIATYDLIVEPIDGVGGEVALAVEVMCHAVARIGVQS